MAVRLPRAVYLAIGLVLTHPRFHPVHRRLYRWSGGRGVVSRALGLDMVLVTTTGRRTGAARTVPLAAVRHDRSWLLVASNAGKARMPAWVHNLRAHPSVRVEHRAESRLHHAREAVGEERAALWPRVVEAYPGYAVYRDRTTRTIPLFVLDPVEVPA